MAVAFSSVPGGGLSTLWYHELPACNTAFKPFAPLGCYNMTGPEVLEMRSEANQYNMTQNGCAAICKGNGFRYAGLAYVGVCYCGTEIEYSAPVSMDNCFYDCSGDKSEKCGGDNYINIFHDTTFPDKAVSTVGDYKYKGCWNDHDLKNGRALIYSIDIPSESMTTEKCLEACLDDGYRFAGTEYFDQCFCGVTLDAESTPVPDYECNTPCMGNVKEMCGGPGRLSVYENDDYESTEPCGYSPPNLSYSSSLPSTPATSAPPQTSTPLSPPKTSESSSPPPKSSDSPPPPPKSSASPPPPPPPPPATITSKSSPSTTKEPVCVTTVPPPRKDQWCLADDKWKSNPLFDWKDGKSCMASVSQCLAQVESCYKNGAWPGSMDCFDFKDWCFDIAKCCQHGHRGSKDKDKCLALNPPNSPTKPVSTVTVPCSATQKPPASVTTSSSKPSPPAPTPSSLCGQPNSLKHNYGKFNPVGGIHQPIVQCNNMKSEFERGSVLKLYDEKESWQCKKYNKEQLPQACQEACQAQYSHCMETYARGCHSTGKHLGKDFGKGKPWDKKRRDLAATAADLRRPPTNYFAAVASRRRRRRSDDDDNENTVVGTFGNDKGPDGHNRWDCDGDEAEAACLHQYKGCKLLNFAQRKPEDTCKTFDLD